MTNFIDVKSMQEVRDLLTNKEFNELTVVLNRLATEKGCKQFKISITPDSLFLGEVRQATVLIWGVNNNKFKFTVSVRFEKFDANEILATPEIRSLQWMDDNDIKARYPIAYSVVRYGVIPRRTGRVAFWNRVR